MSIHRSFEFKFLSYNVAGLRSKISDNFFLNFISEYDIFFLFETFVLEEKINFFSNYFVNYKLVWVPAIKSSKFGRPSGGMLFGIKSTIRKEFADFISINGRIIVSLNRNNFSLLVIPVYLNPSSWLADFNSLTSFVQGLKCDNIIIVGDVNVRIGTAQLLPIGLVLDSALCSSERQSQDKLLNANGSKFLEWVNCLEWEIRG